MAVLKTQVHKLDKVVPVPVEISKLSDVVNNDAVKNIDINSIVLLPDLF